jgi:uncharacterized membrane protein
VSGQRVLVFVLAALVTWPFWSSGWISAVEAFRGKRSEIGAAALSFGLVGWVFVLCFFVKL